MDPIRIGTRSSALALHQANIVVSTLSALGVDSLLTTYETVGDRKLEQSLSSIGGKGLFTAELETDLRSGTTDIAVHSLKDLPTAWPDGLMIAAVLPREDPRDALLIHPRIGGKSLDDLPRGARVGTSSLRRRALLLSRRPDLEVVELRGNVPTRLRKLDEGQVDAAILAAAGLHRLGAASHITSYLEPPEWLPAAGQGAIAVQVRVDDPRVRALAESMNDASTMLAVRAERAFLAALEGGCQVPIGALAIRAGDGLMLHGLIADVGGTRVVRDAIPLDHDPESTGVRLAERLRSEGATEILAGLQRS